MNDLLKKTILFFFFFFSSFLIGYDSISRYDYNRLLSKDNGALSDIATYKRLVEKGFDGLKEEKRLASRLLTPLLSHYIYEFSKDKIRSWNPVFFSLLIVNSIFISLTCLLMSKYYKFLKISKDKKTILLGCTSQFLFLTSFGVSSLYLAGLIDSSICFFSFLLIYSFLSKKYLLVFLSTIFLAFSKETSFIYIFFFYISYFCYQIFFEKKIIVKEFFYAAASFVLNIIIINFYILYFLKMNIYNYVFHFIDTGGAKYYVQTLLDIPHFFIYIIPSLFFFFNGVKLFEKKFVTVLFIMTLSFIFFLQFIINLDGNSMGRYFFDFLGPFICLISGLGFNLFFFNNINKIKF
jgi:hypothetical protein